MGGGKVTAQGRGLGEAASVARVARTVEGTGEIGGSDVVARLTFSFSATVISSVL